MSKRNTFYLVLAGIELLQGFSVNALAKCACYFFIWYGELTRKEFVAAIALLVLVNVSDAHAHVHACIARRECLPETTISIAADQPIAEPNTTKWLMPAISQNHS